MDALVTIATLRRASGVRTFLLENRARLVELLEELEAPALLNHDGGPVQVGLCLENLDHVVQRELWSAFVQWHAVLPTDALARFVERFLKTVDKRMNHSTTDPVSLHLATVLQKILHDERSEDDSDEDSSLGRTDELDSKLHTLVYLPKAVPVLTRASDTMSTRKRRRPSQEESIGSLPPIDNQDANLVSDVAVQQATLAPEVETRLTTIATQLVLLNSPDTSADHSSRSSELAGFAVDLLLQVMNQVHATQQDNQILFQRACTKLQLSATSDDALFQITSGLMEANWSSRYAAMYLDTAILPRVVTATSVISRVLVQTILLYAKPNYATALIDGLLVPLLSMPSIGPSQGEAVTRLLREKCMPIDQVDDLFRRTLESKQTFLLTNEATILVFQNALNMKPTLTASTVELLVGAAASALDQEPTRAALCKSAKFASLIFTLVSKYGPQCSSHVEDLQAIASQLTSVMAKSALRSIQKLKKQ